MTLLKSACLLFVIYHVGYGDEPTHYTAAVYEHAHVSGNPSTRQEALEIMWKNLDIYEGQIKKAKQKGSKIILFPEYGVTGSIPFNYSTISSSDTRIPVYHYMEYLPDADSDESCLACDHAINNSEAFQRLGCLARKYDIYLVANLIESVHCSNITGCPADNHFQYNTNVVFNRSGCLIGKYHKYHLFAEEKFQLDHPSKPEIVVMETELGRLGTIICFDLVFHSPGIDLVEKYKIDTMLFPTYWAVYDTPAAIIGNVILYSSGWARRFGVNILTGNIHKPSENSYGSVIATSYGISGVYCNPKSPDGHLIIGEILAKAPKYIVSDIGRDLSTGNWDGHLLSASESIEGYNMVRLEGLKETQSVCNKHLCCKVDFERSSDTEIYVLGAYVGDPLPFLQHAVEICLVRRCSSSNLTSCLDSKNMKASTYFQHLELSGNFSSSRVYPFVEGANCTLPEFNFTTSSSGCYNYIEINDSSSPILTAALPSWVD